MDFEHQESVSRVKCPDFFYSFWLYPLLFYEKTISLQKSKKSGQPDIWISVIYGFQMSEFWLFTVFLAWAAAFA